MILTDSQLLAAIAGRELAERILREPPARPMCLTCSEYVDECECAEHVDCDCCDDPETPDMGPL